MRIAVTGASGFIGRHVLAELGSRGLAVTAVTHGDAALQPQYPHVKWVVLDIADAAPDSYAALGQPDVLIHLAWGGLPHYQNRRHFEVELPAQYGFLRRMVEGGLKNLLVTGTCYEYGMRNGALREDDSVAPVTPYGYAKDALRQQLEYLQRDYDFNLTWTRLFFVYGDGQAATSLLPQLRAAIARGDASFAMSKGEQLRDYLTAEEVACHAVNLALAKQNTGIINICSGNPKSVRALVERWIQENGWRIALDLGRYPYPAYEPLAFWGNSEKLEKLTKSRSHIDQSH